MCAPVQVLLDTFLQIYLALRFTNAEKTMVNYVHKSVQCGQKWENYGRIVTTISIFQGSVQNHLLSYIVYL